jgi:AcrR family transcriptional regulator
MNQRIEPKAREQMLLDAAIRLAKRVGLARITRDGIALEAGVATGLVSYSLGNMVSVRRAVMIEAIRGRHVELVAQGLAAGDPLARKAPPDLRNQAAQMVLRGTM